MDPVLLKRLDSAIERLAKTSDKFKLTQQGPALDQAARVLRAPGGVGACATRIGAMVDAGIFRGTDWDEPARLKPVLVRQTLESNDPRSLTVETLSELRFLAIARGDRVNPGVSGEQAHRFLAQVLGLNLERLFGASSEAARAQDPEWGAALGELFKSIGEEVGYTRVFDAVIDEIWRILTQRPIQIDRVRTMIGQLSVWTQDGASDSSPSGWGADRLTSALFNPTAACREDPGIEVYGERLTALDNMALSQEAAGMARAMHDTGLVSAYHAVLLRYLRETRRDLIPDCLGLTATGRDSYSTYAELVDALIDRAITVETAQAIYGLSLLLERGILHLSAMPPALWRQIRLPLSASVRDRLRAEFGASDPEASLLAGVVSVLGQPLGVGQGNNPTCQAARAIAMWSYTDPDYLLQLIASAASLDDLQMNFEGTLLSSNALSGGLAKGRLVEVDPVSAVLVPHLDRLYLEMGRLCADRGGDPHEWINPEMHGWWVPRRFNIAVDVPTGKLVDIDGFISRIHATFHPAYNGDQPLIHPSPAGIAVTDSSARFVGWHAIALLRVAPDPSGEMRFYFFNPNNDGGQDWGNGVHVSTSGNGEFYGESSLPFADLASRLYIFHSQPHPVESHPEVSAAETGRIRQMIVESWGADRV